MKKLQIILILITGAIIAFSLFNNENEKVYILAKVTVKKEHLKLVNTELLKLVGATRKEAGCLQYDLHKDKENSNIFIFYEIWENYELWQKHMESPNLKSYLEATDGMIENLELIQMEKVK